MKAFELPPNRRILIVDDNPAIHDDYRKVLAPQQGHEALNALESALFGDEEGTAPGPGSDPGFELTFAFQGQEALEEVKAAAAAGRPFSVAFVDIRMPPGWDGVETTARLWEVDPGLQVVICSAYSDYSWEQMRRRLGAPQQLLILKKPFDNVEVLQLAHALTEKWQLLAASRRTMEDLEREVAARARELEAQRELREQAEIKLRHAQKLEALGPLVGGIAHEINNPLSFVLTNLVFIDEVVRELETGSELHEDLTRAAADALRGADRIRRIVRDVRIFAHAEAALLEPVNLGRIAARASELAAEAMNGRARLAVDVAPEIQVMGSEEGLVQVLHTLLTNAAQAMPAGKADGLVQLTARPAPEGRVLVQVADNGSGIKQADMARIFEPFFSTKPVGQGTGLGLCICHGLLRKMGGRMAVESQAGAGTTFSLHLQEGSSAAEHGGEAPGGSARARAGT